MSRPVHAQPTADVTDYRRAKIRRAADLCRANPALWSRWVQYVDALLRDGLEADAAEEVAWSVLVERR